MHIYININVNCILNGSTQEFIISVNRKKIICDAYICLVNI